MIKDIAYTAYPSKDVAALRKWYEEKLGLVFSGPYVEEGVEQYNEAAVGSGTFSLMNHQWMQREPGSASGIVFEVADLDDSLKSLRADSVDAEEPYETPVCKIASFSDPEGNKVTLHQRTAPY